MLSKARRRMKRTSWKRRMEKGWQLTLQGGSCNVKQGREEDEEDFMEEEDGEGMANHVTCADDKVWKALCLGS